MEINRNYVHRTFGNIGSVTFVAPDGEYTLNGKALPANSVEHLLTFALQTLQDAYAGAKDAAEAEGAFNGKLDKILEGTLGTRSGGGSGVDERTRVARSIVRKAFKAKVGGKSPEWATFTGLDDTAQNEKLDAWFAANEETFTPAVDAEMKARAKAAKDKASLAGAVTFGL